MESLPSWSSVGRKLYGTFRKNTDGETKEIYKTLEKICI